MNFRIPEPPKGMFTEAELAAMQQKKAIREATGTTAVGDDLPELWSILYADHTA